MKLLLTMALFSAACLCFWIARELKPSPSLEAMRSQAVQSEAVTVGCVGTRRCSAYLRIVNGRRVCRTFGVACR